MVKTRHAVDLIWNVQFAQFKDSKDSKDSKVWNSWLTATVLEAPIRIPGAAVRVSAHLMDVMNSCGNGAPREIGDIDSWKNPTEWGFLEFEPPGLKISPQPSTSQWGSELIYEVTVKWSAYRPCAWFVLDFNLWLSSFWRKHKQTSRLSPLLLGPRQRVPFVARGQHVSDVDDQLDEVWQVPFCSWTDRTASKLLISC